MTDNATHVREMSDADYHRARERLIQRSATTHLVRQQQRETEAVLATLRARHDIQPKEATEHG